ncbi:hypothetical protein HDF24_11425 [Mucilaginibacter sp. X4EP1]|uniref:hypothetical protein n=1 Tax=Mucilaginibacter sp. X4EP1 TaxID=2723092 RepID=UPI00216788B4|nr:hypothetical protein [Mucilaginibacter sp. X4EP1]MCS3816618.1 hypothetical protein [Mucilaginibacter sp. X4EP1]
MDKWAAEDNAFFGLSESGAPASITTLASTSKTTSGQSKDKGKKKKEAKKKEATKFWPNWYYYIPVLGQAGASGDDLTDGNYGKATTEEITGILELYMFAENEAISAYNSILGMFSKNAAEGMATQIERAAAGINIYSGQKSGAALTEVVDDYYSQMVNKTFNPKHGVAGVIENGKYILTDGNHKMAAALRYMIEKGDPLYVEQLIKNGNWSTKPALEYGIKIYKFVVK